jgi:ribosome-associated protein
MADTVKTKELVCEVADFIDDHRGLNTSVIDITGRSSFTDFFIITTVSSWTHLRGLYKELNGFLLERAVRPINRHKLTQEDRWVLLDCGDFIIHLMDKEMREFYELEKLWFQGVEVPYSSKSSKSSPSS